VSDITDINGIQDPMRTPQLPRAALFRRTGPALDHQDALAGLDDGSCRQQTYWHDHNEQSASVSSRCASHQRWLLLGDLVIADDPA
jgi:hypothetical protein